VIDPGAAKIIDGMVAAHLNVAVAYESNARRYKEMALKQTDVIQAAKLMDLHHVSNQQAELQRNEISKLEQMRIRLSS
jgi:hypothetical protein